MCSDDNACVERYPGLPAGAARRLERLVEADPDLAQRAVVARLNPDHLDSHARILAGYRTRHIARSDAVLLGKIRHIGQLESLEHRSGAMVIVLRGAGHAGAMLRPLMLHQADRGHHADVPRDHIPAHRRGRRAELGPLAALAIRPQAVQHKAEAADSGIALHVIAIGAGAELRRPRQRQRIAGDRHAPHLIGPGRAAGTWRVDALRQGAGGRLSVCEHRRRQREASRQSQREFRPRQNPAQCRRQARSVSIARR